MIPIIPLERTLSHAQAIPKHQDTPTAIHLTSLPPLALYVHFPWCVRKCPYCDFNSHEHLEGITGLPEHSYLEALCRDLEQALPLIWGRPVQSVFIGGGTPSLLSAQGLDQLLSALRARLPLNPDAEITLEANPGTFEANKFASFRASGINRLSIGVQSFNTRHLQRLGRIHDGDQAYQAVQIARRYFDNFNLDLMYALPEQSLADLERDLDIALALQPSHLSCYHLTIEPNTVFAKYPPILPSDDEAAAMQERIEGRLSAAGFAQYEISAYAQPNRHCRHNLNYWQFGDYLGIGAGAHSKLSFPERIVRQVRYKQPSTYIEHALQNTPIFEETIIGSDELPFEFMLNALRLIDGVPIRLFTERTGLMMHGLETTIGLAQTKGLLEINHELMRATALGQRFLNDLQTLFLNDAP